MVEVSPAGKKAAAAAIAAALAALYAAEGGYVNDARDRGGPTNYGVTQKVARQAGYAGDMRDFPKHCRAVAPAEVCADKIYVARYIEGPGYMPFFTLAPAVASELLDTAANMGPSWPSRWLQASLGVPVDGKVGPRTVAAYQALQVRIGPAQACLTTLHALDAQQELRYRRLAAADPSQRVFLNGWLKLRIGNVDRKLCLTDSKDRP